jgi:hypothetical protein
LYGRLIAGVTATVGSSEKRLLIQIKGPQRYAKKRPLVSRTASRTTIRMMPEKRERASRAASAPRRPESTAAREFQFALRCASPSTSLKKSSLLEKSGGRQLR